MGTIPGVTRGEEVDFSQKKIKVSMLCPVLPSERLMRSACHRSGKTFQLGPCSYMLFIETFSITRYCLVSHFWVAGIEWQKKYKAACLSG